jgi:hypothetical protein
MTINKHAIDRYTSAHFGVGVLAGGLDIPWWGTLLGSVLWETVESPLKDLMPTAFPYSSHDTLLNASADTLAVMAGWGMARLALRQTDIRDRAALEATMASTLGAILLPIVNFAGHLVESPPTARRARLAYGTGTALGAFLGDLLAIRRRAPHTPWVVAMGQATVTGIGGGLAGPLGAGMASYLAASATRNPVWDAP